jgi:hypothetical protein
VTKRLSITETEVPLYLLPQAVARLVREKGEKVYRISVKRTHWHHYNVSVRTRSPPRELRARKDPDRVPVSRQDQNRDDGPGDESGGDGAA